MLLCCLFVVLWTLFEGTLLYTIKLMVDYDFYNFTNNLYYFITIFASIYLIIEACIKATNYIVLKFIPQFSENLQIKLTEVLIYQDNCFYHDKRTEGMAAKIVNLSNIIENLFKTFLYGFLAGLSGFIITIFLVSLSSVWLACCFIGWFFTMLLIGLFFAKKNNEYSIEFAKSNNMLIEELNDILANFITIKAFKKENYELNRYSKNLAKHKNNKQTLELFLFNADFLRSFVSVLFFTVVIYIANLGIAQNETTLGDFVFLISASLICKKDIWRISMQIIDIHKDWGFIQDVIDLIKLTKQNPISTQSNTAEEALQSVEFKNIYFHSNNLPLIDNVSLSIIKGERIAIIGPSGSGKTTLAKLLANLYKMSSGQVILNQKSEHDDHKKLMNKIVYIDQNVNLFDRSICENIFYNNQDDELISDDKIKYITELSLSSNFIEKSANKLETKVRNLSSGQKHLVAVARAMHESPDWLILDEPCVFLDPITEERLIKNILSFVESKTLIVVTHSPKILKLMGRTIIIESGKIVGDSKFDDLKKNEFYRKFINYGE
jgi:ABC-type multidrug transport system fused ATPase/permease subunit